MNKLGFSKVELGFQKNSRYYNCPSIILTLHGCNLSCENCKFTDVGDNKISQKEAKKFINSHANVKHIVIRGGEPLVYKYELEKFLNDIWRDGMIITIHTNGTLPILNPLSHKYRIALYVVNLYEKQLTDDMYYPKNMADNLRNICLYSKDYLLCFDFEPEHIIGKSTEIINKICETDEEFLNNFLKIHNPKDHVVFVPKFKKYEDKIRKICLKNGIMFSNK